MLLNFGTRLKNHSRTMRSIFLSKLKLTTEPTFTLCFKEVVIVGNKMVGSVLGRGISSICSQRFEVVHGKTRKNSVIQCCSKTH